ncbi:MAG: hypothetical protein V3T53_04445 [Phycisphaerales bacterium]
MQAGDNAPRRTAIRWLFVTNGLYYVVAAIGLGVACFVMPSFPKMIVDKNVADIDDLSTTVRWMMDHHVWLPLLAAPLLACGVILTFTPKFRWVCSILGLLAALVPLGVVLYCFIAAMAPLYDPPPL